MALVGEIVARFKAETGDYVQKLDQAKSKNKELATELLKTAGSADKAIGALTAAKTKNALGDFGIDKRQVSGIISQIKQIEKQTTDTAKVASNGWKDSAKEAKEYRHVLEGIENLGSGNILKGITQLGKGAGGLGLGGDGLGSLVGAGVAVAGISIVGSKLKEATAAALELKKQYQSGAISAGEMTEKLLGQVPILGSLWQTGRNIRELFGWENHDLEDQQNLIDGIIESRQKLLSIVKAEREQVEQQNKETQRIKEENEAKALGDKQTPLGGLGVISQVKETKDKAKDEIADFNKKTLDEAQKQKDALDAILQKGNDKGSYFKQRSEQSQINSDAKNTLADRAKRGVFVEFGDNSDDRLKEKLNTSAQNLAQINSLIAQTEKAKAKIDADAASGIKDRTEQLKGKEKLDIHAIIGDKSEATAQAAELAHRFVDGLKGGLGEQPIVGWFGRQIEKVKSGAKDWTAAVKAAQEKQWSDAAKIIEKVKTPVEKAREEIQDVLNNPVLTKDTKGKYLQQDYTSLEQEQKKLQGESDRDVYKLPDVKEVRSGSALFAPPTKTDEQKLKRLQEIKDILQTIRDKAPDTGITLQEVS